MKRWHAVALIGSIVLNVFLLGAIGGSLWSWTHDRGIGLRAGWRVRAADALPPDTGDAFRAEMRATVRGSMPLVLQARAARVEAGRLFVARRFDAAAVQAQLDRARAADVALRARLEQHLVGFAGTLPQDQRAALSGALRVGGKRVRR